MPEVIPELVYIVGLFFAIVGYLAARGLLAAWTHTIGWLLEKIASVLKFSIPTGLGHITIDLGGPVRSIDHAVLSAFQAWCDGAEIQMGYCLHGMEKVARYTAEAVDYLARETAQTFDWLTQIHLPKWAKYAVFPFLIPLLLPKLLRLILPHIGSKVVNVTRVIYREVPHAAARAAVRVVHAGAVALPGWVTHIPRELKGIEREAGRLERRIGRVEALLGAAGIAAVLANVLGVSVQCIRRGNINKFSKALCGLGPRALEDLLGLLADVLIVENICTVVGYLESGLSLIQPGLSAFISTAEAQFVHCGYDLVPDHTVAAPDSPPVTGLTLSLA